MRLSFTQIIEAQLLELRSSELQQIKAFMKAGDYEGLMEYMDSNGWEKFGSGVYSVVYARADSPYVIKVLGSSLDMRENEFERKALRWMRYSQKNWTSNPHLPRIYDITTMQVANGETIYLIVMEWLEHVENDGYMKVLGQGDLRQRAYVAASLLKHDTLRGDTMLEAARIILEYTTAIHPDHDRNTYELDYAVEEIFDEALSSGLPLANTMEVIDNISPTNDLHHRNIMLRAETDELVITDPFRG